MINRRKYDPPQRWAAVLGLAALAMAAGWMGGLMAGRFSIDRPVLASERAKEIKAKAFQLVDDHGATHAALRMSAAGGPGLEFYDTEHRIRVVFEMTGKGDPRLFLMDADGMIRTVLGLGLGADGRPFVRLRDKDGNVIWSAPQP
jgi:hypothetical protein